MSRKTRENQTILTIMDEFTSYPIGNLDGSQIDVKQFEISKSVEDEYRKLRNEVIYQLHKRNIRYSEISNFQVQDIDNSFSLIRIKRGNRVFRVAISKEISEKIKPLVKYKDYKDYVFTKDLIDNKKLSETMIKKIVNKYKYIDIEKEAIKNINSKDKEEYVVERVCDKYFIYKGGKVIEGLVINKRINALRICDVLNAD